MTRMSKKKRRQQLIRKRILVISGCILLVLLTIYFIKLGKSFQTEPSGPAGMLTPSGTPGDSKNEGNVAQISNTPVPTEEPKLMISYEENYAHTGEAKHDVSIGSHFSYVVTYPVYEEAKLSEEVKSAAEYLLAREQEALETAENQDCRLWIDYEDGSYRSLVSVVFHITKEISGEKTGSTYSWLYNKKKDEPYDAEKLFSELAYRDVTKKIKEACGVTGEENAPEVEHLYYLMTEEGARFFYKNGEESGSIVVPYVELHTYMAVTVNGMERMDNIRKLDPDKPMVALTYDDGPHSTNTKRLLQILEKNGAKATFFELGDRLTWSGSKECAQMVFEAGHELASHTYSHANLTRLSVEELQKEFEKTREIIYEYTGEYPTFVRAPGGSVNDTVKQYAFAPLINWSVDTRDWESRDRDKIVEETMKNVRKNRIVLMHDIHTCTVDASEILIPKLIEQGYQLVTLSELFYYNGIAPENGVLYHSVDY